MCLIANNSLTTLLEGLTGTLTVYKNFKATYKHENYKTTGKFKSITNVELIAMHQPGYKWSAKTHSAGTLRVDETNEVHKGIHVCLSKKEAEEAGNGYEPYVTLAFEVPVKDVHAIGTHGWSADADNKPFAGHEHRVNQQAVLKRLTITPKQHREAAALWVKELKKRQQATTETKCG